MDGTDQNFDKEPERYYDWMLWKMRQEDAKMKKGKSMIWVTFQREGIHKYPAALDDPKLATGDEYDVSFLLRDFELEIHYIQDAFLDYKLFDNKWQLRSYLVTDFRELLLQTHSE